MAIINSSSYRILNARTVISILNSKSVQTTSYPHIRPRFYDLKKTSESKILLLVKPSFSSNIQKIYDDIAKLFSVDVLLGGKKVFTTGSNPVLGVDLVITLQRGTSKVEIHFRSQKQDKKAELMRPGILNEEYFVSKINDQIQKINEAKSAVNLTNLFDPNLNIILTENKVEKDTIYKVSSIERTGQDNNKQDVKIKTKDNKNVLISLKKENFGFWSSASEYDAAKKILDYLVNNKLVNYSYSNNRGSLTDSSGNALKGIRVNATVGEVQKFCFGEGEGQVDYILIRSFDSGYFKEIRKITGGLDYKMKINSAKVYKKNARDILRIKKNVYLTIVPSSKNASGLNPYKGLKINFETSNHSSGYYEPNLPGISFGRL